MDHGVVSSYSSNKHAFSFTEPLYIVGAGELGTNASKVDGSLTGILKISATWGAVVLIDEADVFLEERALHHIERNAMVAVFLRHLECVILAVALLPCS